MSRVTKNTSSIWTPLQLFCQIKSNQVKTTSRLSLRGLKWKTWTPRSSRRIKRCEGEQDGCTNKCCTIADSDLNDTGMRPWENNLTLPWICTRSSCDEWNSKRVGAQHRSNSREKLRRCHLQLLHSLNFSTCSPTQDSHMYHLAHETQMTFSLLWTLQCSQLINHDSAHSEYWN